MYVFRNGMIAGNEMALPIGKIGNDYPTRAGESPIIWNWTDNGHDFCFDLWELLGSPYQQTGDIGGEAEGVIYEKAGPRSPAADVDGRGPFVLPCSIIKEFNFGCNYTGLSLS